MPDYATMKAGPDMDALVAEKVMEREALSPVPPYSQGLSITALWEVLETMLHRGWGFSLDSPGAYHFCEGRLQEDFWCCTFARPGVSGDKYDVDEYFAEAATAALAICRAALTAVEEAEKERL